MKKTLLFAVALLVAVTAFAQKKQGRAQAAKQVKTAQAAVPTEADMGAYVMVYHKDQDHGLHMAISYDSYNWTALNDDKPVISGDSIAMQHGIRDPHIFRGPDGGFYLAMTDLHIFSSKQFAGNEHFSKLSEYRDTQFERPQEKYGWGNNRGLVVMKSFDLINWTRTNLDFTKLLCPTGITDTNGRPIPWSEAGCVWAPETVYDYEAGHLLVHFTTRMGTGTERIYYVYMNDDFTRMISEPKLLFESPLDKNGAPRYTVIDSDICRVGDTYHLFYVSHEGTATIKHATSKSVTGPYEIQDDYADGETHAHEAPNCWKRIGRDEWVIMFDRYTVRPPNFGFVETTDFKTYKTLGYFDDENVPMHRSNFTEQKHGAVAPLTVKEAKALEAFWNKDKKKGTKKR